MATALLVAGSTLTFLIPQFASTSSYSSVVQALGCSHNCRRLTCGSFQLTHVTWWPRCSMIELWRPKRRQNIITALMRCHKGEFRHVGISTRQQSLRCGQNLLRATLPMRVGSCAWAMADNGETKGLITPPSRWVSTQLLYACVTAW